MYTYKIAMGDVAKFPNGIEANYSEHDETVVITVPKDKHLLLEHTIDGEVFVLRLVTV